MCEESDSDELVDEFLEHEVEGEAYVPSGATLNSLPEKSRKQYEKVYNRFMDWCEKNEVKAFTESGLLAYFNEKSKDLKSSSLWAEYSMMKATLAIRHDIDIKQFSKVTAFLKSKAVGYRPKLSKAFTREEIYKFIREAPNSQYLMMKIVAIIGIAGACKRDELYRITTDGIEEFGPLLRIKIPLSPETKERSFVVCGEKDELKISDLYRKYIALRPDHTEHNHFFINYRNGKCTVQVVGINTLGRVPCQIAKYLELETPSDYTGHCFRRSSAALFGDNRQDIVNITRELPHEMPSKKLRYSENIDFTLNTSTSSNSMRDDNHFHPTREADDEFSFFGRNIACQLRQLPLEDALQCQSEIMNLISQRRLLLLYGRQQVNFKSSPANNMFSSGLPTDNNY